MGFVKLIRCNFFNDLGLGTTANIDFDASLGFELSINAPDITQVQDKKMTSNNKGNFMKNVKGGIVALLELLVADSHPSEWQEGKYGQMFA